MKILKMDPMTFLMLIVIFGVVLTMSIQASDQSAGVTSTVSSPAASMIQVNAIQKGKG